MIRFSIFVPIILILATGHAYSQSLEDRVIAIQQATLSSLQKQTADLKKKIDEGKVTIGDLDKVIKAQGSEISGLKSEISGLKSEISGLKSLISSTVVTYAWIGGEPTTGTAACNAVGKQCLASYGGDNAFYSCSHTGAWKRVICSPG